MRRALLLLSFAGCPTDPEPSPWINEPAPAPDGSLDAAARAAAVEATFPILYSLDPGPVLAAFQQGLDAGDAECPYVFDSVEDYADIRYWQSDCTADSGASYTGFGYLYSFVDYADSVETYDGWGLVLSGSMQLVSGALLEGGGSVSALRGEGPYYTFEQRSIDGGFSLENADSDWLSGPVRPSLTVTALYVPEVDPDSPTGLDGRQVQLDGALTGLPGAATAIAFDAAVLTEENLGGACDIEPSGGVSIRTADGDWYDVVFDVPEEYEGAELPEGACDGCGRTYFRGEPAGETCIDFRPLLDWEGSAFTGDFWAGLPEGAGL
jgi:hypothetical protein